MYDRYGGNTACVVLSLEGEKPLILDLGTGLVSLGRSLPADSDFRGSALITHSHWDHIQGLPYFSPLTREGSTLDIYGPSEESMSLEMVFDKAISSPLFPVSWRELGGRIGFHNCGLETFSVGRFKVSVQPVPHPGMTVGYRIEADGSSVAYVSDHQMPLRDMTITSEVLDLCDGADLLIHDAQFTADEFAAKPDWGHCTFGYAIEVARSSRVRELAFFHHDPSHDDERMDQLASQAIQSAKDAGVRAVVATEGMLVEVGKGG